MPFFKYLQSAVVILFLVACVGSPSQTADARHPSWWFEGWDYEPAGKQSGEREYLYMIKIISLSSPTQEVCLREAQKLTPGLEMTRLLAERIAPSEHICYVHGNAFPKMKGEVLNCCAQRGDTNSCKEPGVQLATDGCACVLVLKYSGGRRAFENDPVASNMIRCVRAD